MKSRRIIVAVLFTIHLVTELVGLGMAMSPRAKRSQETPGELLIRGADGKQAGVCPLKHTDVEADIAGYVGRVNVKQVFHNPTQQKIEAVYVFPLPEGCAVDDMVMTVGGRRIVGVVKEKGEARKTYEKAKQAGHVASLLDQERPNVFTQSVANIEPASDVIIEISYVETLKYEDGVFEWVFPMVVGPRYMPGQPNGKQGTGWSPDTTDVPDASRISPPIPLPGTRPGHDVSLTVHLDAGMDLFDVKSTLHGINVQQTDAKHAVITLAEKDEIPNRDFILRYGTATDQITDAFFAHNDDRGAYFTLVLQPPLRVPPSQARPKEMIFVIDRSGSQQGFPIEKAKESMTACIQKMNPNDTFNLISFSNSVDKLFERPVPNSPQNRAKALKYLEPLQGDGGTEMLPAIEAALAPPIDPLRLRIVCFMTDGYVGNDFQIIDAVKKHAGSARLFAFGIGNSVNRFLLEGMAHAGRGDVEYVTLASQGSEAAERFHQRIQSPVLTDIKLDWGGLKVDEVYPRELPDLFSHKPMMIHGRLLSPPSGTITMRGSTGAGRFERRIVVAPPANYSAHEEIASLWARARVKDLMMADMAGFQNGNVQEKIKKEIIATGVLYRILTQFTSFVAVDEQYVTRGGPLSTIAVPVHKPDGMSDNNIPAGTSVAQARGGDPLIHVEAPADALHVVAVMPDGEIKPLTFEAKRGRWEGRFDIPTYAAQRDYFVKVIVILRSGARQVLTLRYRVNTTAPIGAGAARLQGGAAGLALQVDSGPSTARVTAVLPWQERIALKSTGVGTFTGEVQIPSQFRGRTIAVTYILTDLAHNRTIITVDGSTAR